MYDFCKWDRRALDCFQNLRKRSQVLQMKHLAEVIAPCRTALHTIQQGQRLRGCIKSYPLPVLVLAPELSDDVTDSAEQASTGGAITVCQVLHWLV